VQRHPYRSKSATAGDLRLSKPFVPGVGVPQGYTQGEKSFR